MFTIPIYIRFALMALTLIGGTILAFTINFWYAFPILLIGLVLTIGYFLFGTVQSAAKMVQENDLQGAEDRLNLIASPKLLFSMNRSYYYMIKGSIAAQRKDSKEAEKYLKLADETGVSNDNERAMIILQKASLAANRGNFNIAKKALKDLKGLTITEETIKGHVAEFEKAMAQSGRIKAAQRQGAYGAKRGKRQPKRR